LREKDVLVAKYDQIVGTSVDGVVVCLGRRPEVLLIQDQMIMSSLEAGRGEEIILEDFTVIHRNREGDVSFG
jgi:hypothetical protein